MSIDHHNEGISILVEQQQQSAEGESSQHCPQQQIFSAKRSPRGKRKEELVGGTKINNNDNQRRSKRRRKSAGGHSLQRRTFRPFFQQSPLPHKSLPFILLLLLIPIQRILAAPNAAANQMAAPSRPIVPTAIQQEDSSSPSTLARTNQRFSLEERAQLRQAFLRRFGLDHVVLANAPIQGGATGGGPGLMRKRAAAGTNDGQQQQQSPAKQVPDYIWALYEAHSTAAPATVQAQTIRHYGPTVAKSVVGGEGRAWLSFNLSATGREPAKEHVVRAELRLPDWQMPSTPAANASRLCVFKRHSNGQREEEEVVATKEWANFAKRPWVEMDGDLFFNGNGTNQGMEDELHLTLHFPAEIDNTEADKMLKSAALIVYSNERKGDFEAANSKQNAAAGRERRRAKRRASTESRGGNDGGGFGSGTSSSSGRQKHHRTSSSTSRGMASSGTATGTSAGSSSARNAGAHHRHHRPHNAGQCRRAELYVDFAELNWQDWIMAPNGYDAYQCKGRCTHPMPAHLNTTNHAIVQSLIHSIDSSAAPAPSCVPVEMSAISILYRDVNDVIVVKTYADMRVEACGCH